MLELKQSREERLQYATIEKKTDSNISSHSRGEIVGKFLRHTRVETADGKISLENPNSDHFSIVQPK